MRRGSIAFAQRHLPAPLPPDHGPAILNAVPGQSCPDRWPSDLAAAFHDRELLRWLHGLVSACPPDSAPCVRLACGERLASAHRLYVLPGSFNPLTRAHLALADAAQREQAAPVLFTLATRTVDKERPEGALLEDRLLVLLLHARTRADRTAAILNRGLYVDQAELLRRALPQVKELIFLVGFDKIVQILDPRYYTEREAALRRLFALASFAVAPRAGSGPRELAALLARPENQPYAPAIRPLDVESGLADISSSAVRAALARGAQPPAELPPESRAFIAATGCYAPPIRTADGRQIDRYWRERQSLLDQLAGQEPPA